MKLTALILFFALLPTANASNVENTEQILHCEDASPECKYVYDGVYCGYDCKYVYDGVYCGQTSKSTCSYVYNGVYCGQDCKYVYDGVYCADSGRAERAKRARR